LLAYSLTNLNFDLYGKLAVWSGARGDAIITVIFVIEDGTKDNKIIARILHR